MKKNRLLLVAPVPPPYGGIGNWVVLIKKHIASKNEIELLDILNTAPRQRGLDGRTIYERVVVQGMAMLKLAYLLRRRIKKDFPSVIHITTSGQLALVRDILFLAICRRKKIRSIYHIHFGRTEEIAKANVTEWRLLKRAVALSDATIVIDEHTEKTLKRYFPSKVLRVANPFDFSTIQGTVGQVSRKEVMFLGWCVKTKGIEELLAAWDCLESFYSKWKLRIVGPYEEKYLNVLKTKYRLQNVIFEGEQTHEEAMRLMSGTGVFILPSYTEGFPNVILEAMAFGKPIIATEVGAIGEMLAGESGLLISPQDSKQIEDALVRVMQDEELRNTLAKNAYQKIRKEYGMDMIYQKLMQIWAGGDTCDVV